MYKGFLFSVIYFPERLFFCFCFFKYFMFNKTKLFPWFKIHITFSQGWGGGVKIWLLFQNRIWFSCLCLKPKDLDPWSYSIHFFKTFICITAVTLPNIILSCTESCKKNCVLKLLISFLYKNNLSFLEGCVLFVGDN